MMGENGEMMLPPEPVRMVGEMMCPPDIYAVVRHGVEQQGNWSFTVLHSGFMSAKAEAERLCLKHKDPFCVLKLVARCALSKIEWEE